MVKKLALEARNLAQQGFTAQQIVQRCTRMRDKVKIYAGLDTLGYLYKGGRISRAGAAVGEITNIKPILHITAEGNCYHYQKFETHKVDSRYPIWSIITVGTENAEKLELAMEKLDFPSPNGSK